jgi:hypothetical protein
MSMSTPGPDRVPSTVRVDKKSGQGKPPASSGKKTPSASSASSGKKATAPAKKSTPAKKTATAGKGPKGRKPITPVKVNSGRSWGPILMIGAVVLIAVGIIGYGAFAVAQNHKETSTPWDQRMTKISGVVDYRQKYPDLQKVANHKQGKLTYPVSPPVGGAHNPVWENCMGNVYDQPIPNENAVHSLEHGAVWITYKPGLAADQIDALKKRVQGKEYMYMSPYTGLDTNVSVQAWGFQLKTNDVNDGRIDDFIKAGRLNASKEPGAACSGGTSATGDTPSDTPS